MRRRKEAHMIINTLNIISFGGLRNCVIDLSDGVNVVYGANESGKTSAAMFIKFVFYGLNGRRSKNSMTERQRYVNRTTLQAAGSVLCTSDDGTQWRIERLVSLSDGQSVRERVRITNMTTGESTIGQNPGEFFFGVPEEVFVSTCFVSQSGQMKPDVSGLSATDTAIGNLLNAADETVDVPRAVKLLDAKRRELMHKNGSGGEISDLKDKRNTLASEMAGTSEKAAEIMQLDASLEDIKKKITELEAADEYYTALFSALDRITAKRRMESLAQTKLALEDLDRQISDLDASPVGEGFSETLLECERDIRAYDEECAVYDERIPQITGAMSAEELPDGDEVITEVQSLDEKCRSQFGMAAAFLISGAVGLGAALVLYYFNTDKYLIPLIMALVLASLGALLIVRQVKNRSYLNTLLDEWDAESPAEIETAVAEKLAVLDRSRMLVLEKQRMDASLEAAKLRFDIASERLITLAGDADADSSGDLYDIIDALHAIAEKTAEKRSEMASAAEKLKGRLELLNEQLDGMDPAAVDLDAYTVMNTDIGKKAASLDKQALANAVRERDFTSSALKTAVKRRSNLEEALAAAGRIDRTPAEYATLISAADARIEELTLRADAYETAKNAILAAGETVRSGVIPSVTARASEMIRHATGDRHDRLTLDTGFNAGLASDGDVLEAEYLSRGTSDLTYLALRAALCDEIFRAESPMLVMDETFAHFDKERLTATLSLLNQRQCLVFTCRDDEVTAAQELGYRTAQLEPINRGG